MHALLLVITPALLLLFTPHDAYAQVTLVGIITALSISLSRAVGLLVAIALVVFLWGVVEFIAGSSDEKKRIAGRARIIWGIIGLTLIITVWGVVSLLRVMIGVDSTAPNCSSPSIRVTGGSVTMVECLN